jgi:hypothetical protein
MAKIRILRKQDKAYIELPPEMAAGDEIELFQLRSGYYLLTMPLGQPTAKSMINERERVVLKKLLAIRFENRTPAHVTKTLSESDMVVLKALERKGLVNVFKGRKYKDGVYNIRDKIYPLLANKAAPPKEEQRRPAPYSSPETAVLALKSHGFVVIPNKREAMSLSDKLGSDLKKGAVIGVKGFDGKFYAVTRNYFTTAQSSINTVLKEDMDPQSIASAAKLDPEGCTAVLRLMAENGEIIEKKKGVFAQV